MYLHTDRLVNNKHGTHHFFSKFIICHLWYIKSISDVQNVHLLKILRISYYKYIVTDILVTVKGEKLPAGELEAASTRPASSGSPNDSGPRQQRHRESRCAQHAKACGSAVDIWSTLTWAHTARTQIKTGIPKSKFHFITAKVIHCFLQSR